MDGVPPIESTGSVGHVGLGLNTVDVGIDEERSRQGPILANDPSGIKLSGVAADQRAGNRVIIDKVDQLLAR